MKPREWYGVYDKTDWGDGAWQSEPDKAQWLNEATRLPCLALRIAATGTFCGYVGVPPGHRAWSALFETENRMSENVLVKIEAARVAAAEIQAAKHKDGTFSSLLVSGARRSMYKLRYRHNVHRNVERYLDAHGGVTYAGKEHEEISPEFVRQKREITLPVMKERAIGYPMGDAQQWVDTWEPLLDDYDRTLSYWRSISITVMREEGDHRQLRWVGFDTAHSGDYWPGMAAFRNMMTEKHPDLYRGVHGRDVYRNLDYIKEECMALAVQLNNLGPRRTWEARY